MSVIPATWEAEIEKIMIQGQPGHIVQETPISKMDWRCGSNSRQSALQVQSPEFKPQSHRGKKKKERERERT
jgi:hypothetical protein